MDARIPLRDVVWTHLMRYLDRRVRLAVAERKDHPRAPDEGATQGRGAQHTAEQPLIGGRQIEAIVEGNDHVVQ